jgi:phosphoenolpyruvate synthase/pyruvate phosphate dikinase
LASSRAAARFAWFFEDLGVDALAIAGGKGASLARMAGAGVAVPPGFVISAEAFAGFLEGSGQLGRIDTLLRSLDSSDAASLEHAAETSRRAIVEAPWPPHLADGITTAYRRLGDEIAVAVRSSALGEDSESASFAGQQETFLNVRSAEAVLQKVRECWASLFSARALFYRSQKHVVTDTRMAVVVQAMVQADKSGVMFTVDPVSKDPNRLIVEAVFGLGESIVSGIATPDHYVLDKQDGRLARLCVSCQEAAILSDPLTGTKTVELSPEEGRKRVLSSAQLDALRCAGLALENHFGRPQDVEWCLCGDTFFFVQSRPITTL